MVTEPDNNNKDLKNIIEKLKDEAQDYLTIISALHDSVVVANEEKIEFCNKSFFTMFQIKDNEALNMSIFNFFSMDTANLLKEKIQSGKSEQFEGEGLSSHGMVIPVKIRVGPIDKNTNRIGLSISDKTKEYELQNALDSITEKYSTLLNNSLIGIYIIQNGTFKEVNDFMIKESGHSREEFLSWGLLEFAKKIHPDDKDFVFDEMGKKLRDEPNAKREYSFRTYTKEGELRWVSIYSATITYDDENAILAILVDITEQKRVEEALIKEKEFVSAILENSYDGIAVVDNAGLVISVNPAIEKIFGYTYNDMPNMFNLIDLIFDDKTKDEIVQYWQKDSTSLNPPEREFYYFHKNGEKRWARVQTSKLKDKLFIINAIDITETKRAEIAIKDKEHRFRTLADSTFEGILITDSLSILNANKAFLEMFGYSFDKFQAMRERSPLDFIEKKDKKVLIKNFVAGYDKPFEVMAKNSSGESFPIEVQIMTIGAVENDERVIAVRDITHKREIEYFKTHDAQTGLLNLNGLLKEIAEYIRFEKKFDLMTIEISNEDLSNINQLGKIDYQGMEIKEFTLMQLSETLRNVFFEDDQIARSENEFIVLLSGSEHQKYSTRKIIEKALSVFPYRVTDLDFLIRATIGITNYPQDYKGDNPKVIVNNANTAIKWARKNSISFMVYNEDQDKILRNLIGIEQDLNRAVERIKYESSASEFELYYQSKVDKNEKIVGSEALLRWNHPDRGILLPNTFIKISEQTGLIDLLGKHVLQMACRQLKEWNMIFPELKLSVNISSSQLTYSFVDWFSHLIIQSDCRINPHNLELEITETESLSVENIDALRTIHDTLKVKIAIDDFGVEKSSLMRLKELPVDIIKIDKSFVDTMLDTQNDSNLVIAIIKMGHSLGLTVVAEGVENRAQYNFLKDNNCDLIQGFYLGRKPFPKSRFEQSLQDNYL